MRTSEMPGGQTRVFLNPFDYRKLLDSAPKQAAHLVLRLGGESGLKVSEMVNVQMDHIKESSLSNDFFFLHIPLTEDDESLEFARGRPRNAYLPKGVYDEMYELAEERDLDYDEPIFNVTKRTLQDYVKQSGKKASYSTNNSDFEKVSSKDLRVYFAKQSIERKHIHPNVVMEVGGWGQYDNLRELLEAPEEQLIVREFERADYLESFMDSSHQVPDFT